MRRKPGKGKQEAPKQAALLATTASVRRSKPKTKAAILRAEPGPDGIKLLAIVEAYKRLWANVPDQDKHPRAFDRHEQRSWGLNDDGNTVVRRISRRQPRTLSDVVDLLLAFQWRFQNEYSYSDLDEALSRRMLAIGGLTLGQVVAA
jgi:hypothetical protein